MFLYFHLAGRGGKLVRFPGWLSSWAKRQPSQSRCKARLCVGLRGINANTELLLAGATSQPVCTHRDRCRTDFSGRLKGS